MKNWAYRQDQLVTTHPIAGQVLDTDQTFLNFDGITYGKGASVLNSSPRRSASTGFRDGMRLYFQRHAYGNTDLSQFLAALEDGSGRDLDEWSKLWLETASLNTISASYESDGDRVTSLEITQTAPPDYPTIRPHRLDIGLLRADGGRDHHRDHRDRDFHGQHHTGGDGAASRSPAWSSRISTTSPTRK